MYVYMYVGVYLSLSIYLSLYIYTHSHTYVYMYIYIHIYIYIHMYIYIYIYNMAALCEPGSGYVSIFWRCLRLGILLAQDFHNNLRYFQFSQNFENNNIC